MFCDEALDSVEAIAAGDLRPEGRVADHLATCPNCALALTRARQLEASLQRRAVPEAPAQFTSRTLARIRRARWRTDQFLDVGFNLAIGTIVFAVLGAVWMLLHRTGLAAVSGDAVNVFGSGFVSLAKRVAPALPLYAGAAALLVSALGLWWWAERDAAL
jgi:anti-sigma factor RsiW